MDESYGDVLNGGITRPCIYPSLRTWTDWDDGQKCNLRNFSVTLIMLMPDHSIIYSNAHLEKFSVISGFSALTRWCVCFILVDPEDQSEAMAGSAITLDPTVQYQLRAEAGKSHTSTGYTLGRESLLSARVAQVVIGLNK